MSKSYAGKVLRVDLSTRRVWVEEPEQQDPHFYHTYWGGSCLGTYYLLKEVPLGADPLGPDNALVFATSAVSGAEAPGLARYAVLAKSPLTGGVGEALAEGYWGPALKSAGFDAVVIRGASKSPVYLSICDGDAKIRDASSLWGMDTAATCDAVRAELDEPDMSVACIGLAGENRVLYASIVSDAAFMNARTGLGAVMGSKGLKAIGVKGAWRVAAADPGRVAGLAEKFGDHFQENFVNKVVFDLGTAGFLAFLNASGLVSSRNGQTTAWDEWEAISGERIQAAYFDRRTPCSNCPAACHRLLKGTEEHAANPRFGSPELEPLMAFGNDCGVSDLGAVLKAHESCMRLGLDPTSTGAAIAFAMECFERGILLIEGDADLDLHFGNAHALLELIERIAHRNGIGELLAEGVMRASRSLGPTAVGLAMHVKGLEMPLHDARTKAMLGLSYALSPIGPDDMAVEHDTDYDADAPQLFMDRVLPLGLWNRLAATDLSPAKIRMLCYLQQVFSFMDSLCLCKFAFAPCRYFSFTEMVELVSAICGWETSLWDLMKLGERRLAMQRCFNVREGLGPEADSLPPRVYEPIASGPNRGVRMDRGTVERAKATYYRMRDWDPQTGLPSDEKLVELDLAWLRQSGREQVKKQRGGN